MRAATLIGAGVVAVGVVAGVAAVVSAPRGCGDGEHCCMRPAGAPAESCLRDTPGRGVIDFGAENVMVAAEAVGSGCVPALDMALDPHGACVPLSMVLDGGHE